MIQVSTSLGRNSTNQTWFVDCPQQSLDSSCTCHTFVVIHQRILWRTLGTHLLTLLQCIPLNHSIMISARLQQEFRSLHRNWWVFGGISSESAAAFFCGVYLDSIVNQKTTEAVGRICGSTECKSECLAQIDLNRTCVQQQINVNYNYDNGTAITRLLSQLQQSLNLLLQLKSTSVPGD